jgi:Lytic polysaccharide mono-oxygenase, cellulose-degrading
MTVSVIKRSKFSFQIIFFTILTFYIKYANTHGRLIEPPSRATAWRFGFKTPENYNDHELFCGGYVKQYQINGI